MNIKDRIQVNFTDFGLNNPTKIQFMFDNEMIMYSCTGKTVEQISKRIKQILGLFTPYKPIYKTSPYLFNQIRLKSLASPMKSVWTLFAENGITILGGKMEND